MLLLSTTSHDLRWTFRNCAHAPAFRRALHRLNSRNDVYAILVKMLDIASHDNRPQALRVLAEVFGSESRFSGDFMYFFATCCKIGHLESAQALYIDQLISYFDDVILNDALEQSCAAGQIAVVEWLLSISDNLDLDLALRRCAGNSEADIIHYDSRMRILREPKLEDRSHAKYLDIARLLLRHGADVRVSIEEPLKSAAHLGNLEMMQVFLDAGANLEVHEGVILVKAVHQNQQSVVEFLLKLGFPIDIRDGEPLRVACRDGNVKMVELLLDRGADMFISLNRAYVTALDSHQFEVVQLLIDRGADLHYSNELALKKAIRQGNISMCQYLLQKGARMDALNIGFIASTEASNRPEFVRMLVEDGKISADELLDYVLEHGYLKVLKALLTSGVSLRDNIDFVHVSPKLLHSIEYYDLILSHGVIAKRKKFLNLVLCEVSQWDVDVSVVRYLLQSGASATTHNNQPLQNACINFHIHLIRLLIQHGADIHLDDGLPLRHAACFVCPEILDLLLVSGANVHAREDEALRASARFGYLNNVEVLIKHGADVHACDNEALREAAERGDMETVKYLINHGADPLAMDKYAFRAAMKRRHISVAKFLKECARTLPAKSMLPQ